MKTRVLGRLATLILGLALGVSSTPAHAWDPSTTHTALVDQAALQATVHHRWMDASEMKRGLFTSLTLDPKAISDPERRAILRALDDVQATSGAAALGGPGACPKGSVPPSTRLLCVRGDRWELTALGWIRLGVMVEGAPRARLLHHFVDPEDPTAARWRDKSLSPSFVRRQLRRAGESVASIVNGQGYTRRGATSALAWLDSDDRWAPPAISEHLRSASLATEADERTQHLVLALIGIGATLHVIQDLTTPAHARGDLAAFFLPLSDLRDRGLPLQEYVRSEYGRHLPQTLDLSPRHTDPRPDPTDGIDHLGALLLGVPEHWEGLLPFTRDRFFSEGTLPSPKQIDRSLSPTEAAIELLSDVQWLRDAERVGATLLGWPNQRGYLLSATGRMLAAYETDDTDHVRVFLDRRVLRSQAVQLLPRALDASQVALDLMLPTLLGEAIDTRGGRVRVDLSGVLGAAAITVLQENRQGHRTVVHKAPLPPETSTYDTGVALSPDVATIVVLEVQPSKGPPWFAEHRLPVATDHGAEPSVSPETSTSEPQPDEPSSPEPDASSLEPTTTEPSTSTSPETDSTPEPTTTEPSTSTSPETDSTPEPTTTEPSTPTSPETDAPPEPVETQPSP